MKAAKFLIAAVLVAAPLCFANAAPMIDAGPAGIHPAELSLPGVVSDLTVAMDTDTAPRTAGESQVEVLHPSQLSLEGEVVEDVLVPPERQASPKDLLACGR